MNMFWPQLQDILYAAVKSREFVFLCMRVLLHPFLSHFILRMAVNVEAVGFAERSVLFV